MSRIIEVSNIMLLNKNRPTPPAAPSNAYSAYNPPNPSQSSQGNNPGMFSSVPESFMGNPMMTGMAMQYGNELMGRGGEEFKKNLDKYVSIGQLKYYFAVDTSYVTKKLGVLLFPFMRSDWSIKCEYM